VLSLGYHYIQVEQLQTTDSIYAEFTEWQQLTVARELAS